MVELTRASARRVRSSIWTRNGATSEVLLTDPGDPPSSAATWTMPLDANRRAGAVLCRTAGRRPTGHAHRRRAVRPPAAVLHARQARAAPHGRLPGGRRPAETLKTLNNVAPRIGVSDRSDGRRQDGRQGVLRPLLLQLRRQLLGASIRAGRTTKNFVFNDLNGNRLYDGPQANWARCSARRAASSTTFDPNMQIAYTDEIDLSVERQFWGESSVRAAYVRKMKRNQFADLQRAAAKGSSRCRRRSTSRYRASTRA